MGHNWLTRILEETATTLFAGMILVVIGQVFLRYVLGIGLLGTLTVAILLFQWSTMVGAAVASARGLHITVDFLVKKLPGRVLGWALLGSIAVQLLFLAYLLAGGIALVEVTWDSYSQAVVWMRFGYQSLAIPVGAALMLGYTVAGLPRAWRLLRGEG
ncbi:MAG TPA: TRAP transporter small permease subunit [Candidatus Methylomirabilis sp.]|nr:TRAP transporter small permease subunit [Candidatus Methylomirabilis sp.]